MASHGNWQALCSFHSEPSVCPVKNTQMFSLTLIKSIRDGGLFVHTAVGKGQNKPEYILPPQCDVTLNIKQIRAGICFDHSGHRLDQMIPCVFCVIFSKQHL